VETVKELLMKRIVGEIILSDNPGEVMRRWREVFGIAQLEMADNIRIPSSVISDYERGRRPSPGAAFVKKYVTALIEIDRKRGGRILNQFSSLIRVTADAVLDLAEFRSPIPLKDVVAAIDGEFLTGEEAGDKTILGYTIVDSIKAILTMSGSDFLQLMGTTSQRALIFTKVSTGRSPLVAVRVTPLKPAAVVLHGVTHLDRIAVEIAKAEQLPLVLARKPIEELIKALHSLHG